jgi:hypothetical protein
MKEYNLSNTQWATLWLSRYPHWQINNQDGISTYIMQKEYMTRVKIFTEKFPNLYYRETDTIQTDPGYYGTITYHDDKDITFLLLQL